MSEIFLYTKAAKVGDTTRKRLIEAGYIPVEVADENAVRILPMPVPAAQLEIITRAALRAIHQSQGTILKSNFSDYLTEALLAQKQPKP